MSEEAEDERRGGSKEFRALCFGIAPDNEVCTAMSLQRPVVSTASAFLSAGGVE